MATNDHNSSHSRQIDAAIAEYLEATRKGIATGSGSISGPGMPKLPANCGSFWKTIVH